jgi:hypothetical protein
MDIICTTVILKAESVVIFLTVANIDSVCSYSLVSTATLLEDHLYIWEIKSIVSLGTYFNVLI